MLFPALCLMAAALGICYDHSTCLALWEELWTRWRKMQSDVYYMTVERSYKQHVLESDVITGEWLGNREIEEKEEMKNSLSLGPLEWASCCSSIY